MMAHKPPVDLDALIAKKLIKVIEIDSLEAQELRGHPRRLIETIDRPISEQAIKMSMNMKHGKPETITVASARMILTIRRLYIEDLERIVSGTDLAVRCREKSNVLVFDYVKRR